MWWLIGGALSILVLWFAWRSWNHPVNALVRQAAHMGWVAVGVDTSDGYRNTKLRRGDLVAVVWYRDANVELRTPSVPHRFADFVALERWLAQSNAADESEPERECPETRYYQEVEDFIRQTGHYYNLVLPAQTIPDFMEASAKVYKAGFLTNASAKVIGALVADGANQYKANPELGLLFLYKVAENLYEKHTGSASTRDNA